MSAEARDPDGSRAPHYLGHRERLRARFRQAGADALSDYELLELVLFRAIPRRDVKPLAKELIRQFGSFNEVISMAAKHKVANRIASYIVAVDRVAAMHRLRGMYA